MTAFNALFAANANKQVLVNDKATGAQVLYKVARLSDKMGVMKNGDKAEYVILTAQDGTTTVISLHPQAASALFKKGEQTGMKIVEEVKPVEVVEAVTVTPILEEVKGDEQQAGAEEAAPVANGDEQPAETPKVSKKAGAIALIHAGWDAGQQRKDILLQMQAELGLTVNGSATYYNNVKSGAWGGRKN